jgi:anti-sigma factor RsiW
MTQPIDPVGDADLLAYIDDELSPERRVAVEDYLSQRPELAARVMSDLRGRDELRLAMGEQTVLVRLETQVAAHRLQGALVRDSYFATVRRWGAVAALIALGWFAHAEFLSMGKFDGASLAAAMPSYVDEAARAHKTALLRASMHSQPVQPEYDREEIRSATAIDIPALPADWEVLDVQIFPSAKGPAVEIAVKAGDLGTLSLFAVRPGRFDVLPARVTSNKDLTAAYWQMGDVGYALVGAADGGALNEAATKLSASLY